MKATVRDVMNPKLLYIREGDRIDLVRHPILEFGVTAVPVLDLQHRPVGVVSLRDLLEGTPAHVSTPAVSIVDSASIDDAARLLGEGSLHHVVVVDAQGKAVGMLSAIDVLRAMVGLPAKHPKAFGHLEATQPG